MRLCSQQSKQIFLQLYVFANDSFPLFLVYNLDHGTMIYPFFLAYTEILIQCMCMHAHTRRCGWIGLLLPGSIHCDAWLLLIFSLTRGAHIKIERGCYDVFFAGNFRALYLTKAFAEQSANRLLIRKLGVLSSQLSVTSIMQACVAQIWAGPFADLDTC